MFDSGALDSELTTARKGLFGLLEDVQSPDDKDEGNGPSDDDSDSSDVRDRMGIAASKRPLQQAAKITREESGQANYVHNLGKRVAAFQRNRMADSLASFATQTSSVTGRKPVKPRKATHKVADKSGVVGLLSPRSGQVRISYNKSDSEDEHQESEPEDNSDYER